MQNILNNRKYHIFLCNISVLIALFFGCDKQPSGQDAASESKTDKGNVLSDKPLVAFQNELLDLAFETASAIPVDPHSKDRARMQEMVVLTCLKLDQPGRASRYIEHIGDWRRGAAYADLAFYCARHGFMDQALAFVQFAEKISETAEDWRRDTIRVKIAQTHAFLGQTKQADQFAADVQESEIGKVESIRAMIGDETSFEEQVKILDSLIAPGNFDILKNALQAYAQLFNRFYDDSFKRILVEEKIKASWDKLPVFIRIELLMQMAGFSLDHKDQSKAIALVDEAQKLMDSFQWPLDKQVPMAAQLVGLRFRAGDLQNARENAETLRALYNADGKKIVNIHRAQTLRPLAEAYQAMHDTDNALAVYKQAVEEGVENPNSRPRAEDLSATCCSMALAGVEPDAELWARMHQIREGLGQPW